MYLDTDTVELTLMMTRLGAVQEALDFSGSNTLAVAR